MLWNCILKFADFRVLQCVVLCSADVRAIDASSAGITRCGQCDTGVCWPWLRMIPVTQAGAPCSVSVYASVSVTTDGGDGAQCPGHCRVSPLPVTLRSPLHHSPLSSHPEKGDTDTDSRPRPCARCGVAQVSSLDTSHLRLRIPQIATREATKLINKSP